MSNWLSTSDLHLRGEFPHEKSAHQLPVLPAAGLLKCVPAVPVFYVVFVKKTAEYNVEVRLLRFTAFLILAAVHSAGEQPAASAGRAVGSRLRTKATAPRSHMPGERPSRAVHLHRSVPR